MLLDIRRKHQVNHAIKSLLSRTFYIQIFYLLDHTINRFIYIRLLVFASIKVGIPITREFPLAGRSKALKTAACLIIRCPFQSTATSVFRIFPSAAGSFKALQFVTVSFPSFLRRFFNTLQYVYGLSLSVNTVTTSTIEKYHFSSSSFQIVRTFQSSNNLTMFLFLIY